MFRIFGLLFFLFFSVKVLAQTCTISGTGNISWNPLITPTCQEIGQTTVNSSIILIPAGVNLIFDDNTDTWTGTKFQVSGVLRISANIVINASIEVLNGGVLEISNGSKLDVGSASDDPCPYTVSAATGGRVDFLGGGTTDRLRICNKTIAIPGGGTCNPYPAGPIPYCEPIGGFTGPFVFDEGGLPVELLFFKASKSLSRISLSWATASELNFDYFDVEKSADGKAFHSISKVVGHGTTNERQDYSIDDEKPHIGKNYYRLKSVDFDGYAEYFNVVLVDFDGSKGFSVFPNPSDGSFLNVETNFVPGKNSFVALYATTGAEIARFKVNGELSTLTLPMKLEPGCYYAKFLSSEFTSVSKLLVK